MTAAASSTDTGDIVARLTDVLGPARVVTDAEALADLGLDQFRWRRAVPGEGRAPVLPLAGARPHSTDEVAAIVRIAGAAGAPLVQYGGGTGLMGGARTITPGIVLDMRGMNRVLDISPEDRTATAQAGTVLADVAAALRPHGLMLGHDPWTVPIATVGGTISTNSLGYRGAKYGSMGDQVLGLEVVLPDASVLRTRAVPRSATGPRLQHLFVGAEGAFGVITAATLRIFPKPEQRQLLALDFPSFAHGFTAVQAMFAIGLVPAMVDYGAPPGGQGRMYLAFEGFAEEVAAQTGRARPILTAHGGVEQEERAARQFWQDRHVSPRRLQSWRRGERDEPRPGEPGSVVFDYMHMSLPASRVLPYIARAEEIFTRRGVDVREWGLWNTPELLSTVVVRETGTPAALAAIVTAIDAALMLAQDMGGSMEYVHGVGVRYAHLMEREHGTGLGVLRALKRALDPEGALNPGKLGL